MKLMTIVLSFLVSLPLFANWHAISTCNGGELVIDQGDNDPMGRPVYQMVLRGEPLRYFVQQGAVLREDINSKGEFIMGLLPYDSQLMGSRTVESEIGKPFKYLTYWVSRYGAGDVFLVATRGNHLEGEGEKARWTFHNCR
jgi:hypothetical protein